MSAMKIKKWWYCKSYRW